MNTHTITIAIPVRNGEKYLKEAINSALNQTVSADEVLVFINNTQDKSLLIAEEFLPRVRIVEENTNFNIGQAWNRLYELSKSEYVLMLHMDDKLTEIAVEKTLNAINQDITNAGFIFGRSYFNKLNEEDKYLINFSPDEIPKMSPSEFQLAILTKGFLPFCSGLCLDRQMMVNLRFNEKLSLFLDLEFFHRILYHTKGIALTDIISFYRKHNCSTYHSAKIETSCNDIVTWIHEIEDGAINIPDEFRDEYKGFVLRRLSIFYSNLIYDYQIHLASRIVSLWKEQIPKYPDIYTSFVTKAMRTFIGISLIDSYFRFPFSFVLARVYRFIFLKKLSKKIS